MRRKQSSAVRHAAANGLDAGQANLLKAFEGVVGDKVQPLNEKIVKIEERVATIDTRVANVEKQNEAFDARLVALEQGSAASPAASVGRALSEAASAMTDQKFVPPKARKGICVGGYAYNEGKLIVDDLKPQVEALNLPGVEKIIPVRTYCSRAKTIFNSSNNMLAC